MNPLPLIGAIVLYQPMLAGRARAVPPSAAIITERHFHKEWVGRPEERMTVRLCVLSPQGMQFTEHLHYSHTLRSGHWSWPDAQGDDHGQYDDDPPTERGDL